MVRMYWRAIWKPEFSTYSPFNWPWESCHGLRGYCCCERRGSTSFAKRISNHNQPISCLIAAPTAKTLPTLASCHSVSGHTHQQLGYQGRHPVGGSEIPLKRGVAFAIREGHKYLRPMRIDQQMEWRALWHNARRTGSTWTCWVWRPASRPAGRSLGPWVHAVFVVVRSCFPSCSSFRCPGCFPSGTSLIVARMRRYS